MSSSPRIHPSLSAALFAVALAAPLAGCGYTQNVRAYRAYAYESPSLEVALDRTEDLSAALELVDRLLTQTPFSPGDEWIKKLALTDAEAQKLRDEVRLKPPYDAGPNYEVPVVKLYRMHLEKVLSEAKSDGAKYPSVLDAVGALGSDSKDIKAHWAEYYERTQDFLKADAAYEKVLKEAYPPGRPRNPLNDPPEVQAASKVRDEAKDEARKAERKLEADIASLGKGGDAEDRAALLAATTSAVSVAYRIELEALAMLPIVAIQAVRSLPDAREELSRKPSATMRGVSKLADVPDHIDSIKEKMSRQTRLLDLMTDALAAASKTSLEATAGFALKESVVDQVVGVTLDSFRAQAKAGGEAFFYSALKQDDKQDQSQQGGGKKDLTGRLRTLSYDVKPILFTAFNLNLGFDYIQIPNAAGLSFGYKTDRVFSSGGTIQSGSFAQQLGVTGFASDALDFGLGVLGVKTAVRLARFTTGTVTYVDAATGAAVIGPDGSAVQAPLQINFTQVDLGYDIAFLLGEKAGKYYIEELTVGGRYFEYKLPRLLYLLENRAQPGSDPDLFYINESLPQTVPSKYYMGGVTARFGKGDAAAFSPYGELGFYFGGGPTRYDMRVNKAQDCRGNPPAAGSECVDDLKSDTFSTTETNAIGFDMSLALGLRIRLVKPGRRFRLNGEVLYRGELIYANAGAEESKDGKQRQVDFGNADLFHGPRFNLVGEF